MEEALIKRIPPHSIEAEQMLKEIIDQLYEEGEFKKS